MAPHRRWRARTTRPCADFATTTQNIEQHASIMLDRRALEDKGLLVSSTWPVNARRPIDRFGSSTKQEQSLWRSPATYALLVFVKWKVNP